jgi:hypothetical protein
MRRKKTWLTRSTDAYGDRKVCIYFSAFARASAFQHLLTTKKNAVLTMIVAPIRHAKSVRRQVMWDLKRRVCGAARPLA